MWDLPSQTRIKPVPPCPPLEGQVYPLDLQFPGLIPNRPAAMTLFLQWLKVTAGPREWISLLEGQGAGAENAPNCPFTIRHFVSCGLKVTESYHGYKSNHLIFHLLSSSSASKACFLRKLRETILKPS